ncbi:hypothetical protein BJ165DRAFT_1400362 [Panaeolus papilionaceus]|nr:hypothetical protein BJ165DRAFT_1400362 [Panaeolus papilionaceus]
MTTICSSTPTATTTTLIPTITQSVTTTDSVSTLPGTTIETIIATTTCFGGSDDDCIDDFITTTTTLPGPVFVTQVPLTIAIDTFVVQTTTLFGQTCSVVTSPVSRPNTSTPTPRITPSRTDSSVIPSQTLDPPPTDNTTEKPFPIGPVVGGAVGGLVVIGLIGFILWKYFHKPSPPNFGNHEVHPDKYDAYGQENVFNYQSNLAPQGQQPPPGQQSTPNQQQQQQQQQQVDEAGTNTGGEESQWDRPDRLPGRLEQKLAQKFDNAFGKRRSSEENANAQTTGSPQFPQAQIPNHGQMYQPPAATTSVTYSTPSSPSWGRPTINQFNIAAPGIPHAQVTSANQHLQTQYSGYAEPAQ